MTSIMDQIDKIAMEPGFSNGDSGLTRSTDCKEVIGSSAKHKKRQKLLDKFRAGDRWAGIQLESELSLKELIIDRQTIIERL